MQNDICVDKARERIKILRFDGDGNKYSWYELLTVWANVRYTSGRNNYSSAGIGAENICVTMRSVPIRLDDALLIGGRHCIITEIDRRSRPGWIIISAAAVTVVDCISRLENPVGEKTEFPAIITEKYIRHERAEPYSLNVISYVLITPKAIRLEAGGLVGIDGIAYEIQCCHMLGEHKNEYEIVKTIDL